MLGRHSRWSVWHLSLRLLRWFTFLVSGSATVIPFASADEMDLGSRHQQLRQVFREQLLQQGSGPVPPERTADPRPASPAHAWLPGNDPSRNYFFVPPDQLPMDPAGLSGQAAPAAKGELALDPVLQEMFQSHASRLYSLAEQAAAAGQAAHAYQLLHETLLYDPGHRAARRWLQLPLPSSRSSSAMVVRPGRRAHARYGWLPGRYHTIITAHYQITTNESPDAAARLARVLEQVHGVWHQLFFDFWSSAEQFHGARQGRAWRRAARSKYQIVLFASRREYLEWIRRVEPRADVTRGYYAPATRTAYFAGGPDADPATWRHEATHQLFSEFPGSAAVVGSEHNFWLAEGIALYMESLQECGPWLTVGGIEADRLQYARYRLLREDYFLPLQPLCNLNQAGLQRHPEIRQLYTQAAGVTHFLMHHERGRFVPALQTMLRELYQRRDQSDSLTRHTGASWEDLDASYRHFLKVDDAALTQLDARVTLRNLALGNTAVTDAGLSSLPALDQLEWLDLAGTAVTDAGTESLAQARRLVQVSFEQTRVGDATVERLAGSAEQLRQLDLSGTQVTDAAAEALAKLQQLEQLWLTNTAITDEAVPHLRSLPQLQSLDVAGTGITVDAATILGQGLSRPRPVP